MNRRYGVRNTVGMLLIFALTLIHVVASRAAQQFPADPPNHPGVFMTQGVYGNGFDVVQTTGWSSLSIKGEVTSDQTVSIFDAAYCLGEGSYDQDETDDISLISTYGYDNPANCLSPDPDYVIRYDICYIESDGLVTSCERTTSAEMGFSAIDDWYDITVSASLFRYDPVTNLSVAVLRVTPGNSAIAARSNQYKVRLDGGDVGSFARDFGSYKSFTMVNPQNAAAFDGHYVVQFGTPCEFENGLQTEPAQLVWHDADHVDAGSFDWSVEFTLTDLTSGTVVLDVSDPLLIGGDDASRSMGFTAQLGHKYEWRWHNIHQPNHIQMDLPYDSNTFELNPSDCTLAEGDYNFATCDDSGGWAVDYRNFNVQLKVRVYINDTLAMTTNANLPSTGPSDPGGNHRFKFSIPAAYRDGVERTVRLMGVDINGDEFELEQSPRKLTCHSYGASCDGISGLASTVAIGSSIDDVELAFKNTGTEAWNSPDYELVSIGDPWGLDTIPIDTFVVTNSSYSALLDIQAPSSQGTYSFSWQVKHIPSDSLVGSPCSKSVKVENIWDIKAPRGIPLQSARLPGQDWDVTVELENIGSGASYGSGGPADGKVAVAYSFELNGSPANPSGWSGIMSNESGITINSSSSWITSYTLPVPASLVYGDRLCVRISITGVQGEEGVGVSFNGPRINPLNSTCFLVAEQPYFEVHKGSLWSGGVYDINNPSGGGWCKTTEVDTGFVRGANVGGTGIWTEYGSFARGDISGLRTGTDPLNPNYLTFKNDSGLGNYSDDKTRGRCIIDYYTYLNHNVGVTVLSTFPAGFPRNTGPDQDPSGQYFFDAGGPGAGSITIGDVNLTQTSNKQITLIVDGDVIINGNITNDASHIGGPAYIANTSDSNPDNDIPMFILVASGSIRINGNVEHLHGLYVAREGGIDTCYDEPRLVGSLHPDYNKLHTGICNKRLMVRGSLVTDELHLRRTLGGILGGGGVAERFEQSPDFNLAISPFVSDLLPEFDILQVEDLPPIY